MIQMHSCSHAGGSVIVQFRLIESATGSRSSTCLPENSRWLSKVQLLVCSIARRHSGSELEQYGPSAHPHSLPSHSPPQVRLATVLLP